MDDGFSEPVRREPAAIGEIASFVSRYGTLRTWALELGYEEAAEILQSTLEEEQATDLALTAIARSVVNQKAEG